MGAIVSQPGELVAGTRGSALALWQTEHVVGRLKTLSPGPEIAVRRIRTAGDVTLDRPLAEIGGQGLFVTEIEQALLAGEIHLAVHSLKDMPTRQPDGLVIAAILERGEARDALVVRGGRGSLASLPRGACVGTSSLRRGAQVLAARPDLQLADLRGNVDTRLHKLERGDYDALILAAAGLIRLGRADSIAELLPVEVMMPAPGQGALCVEVRAGDEPTRALVARLDHWPTRLAVEAERAWLAGLGGGCQAPAGAYAAVDGAQIHLRAVVISPDGRRQVRDEIPGPALEGSSLGAALAARMLAAGAAGIIQEAACG